MYGKEHFPNKTRDEMCDKLVNQSKLLDFGSDLEHRIFVAVCIVSIIFSITVFLTTIWNEKLN